MRRTKVALGASVLAFAALNAAPAAAQVGDPGQQVADSTGAAQVGAVEADVPVRVLSDGNNAEPAAVTAAPQDSGDSTATAQAGAADVDAPVRVLSDGDNAGGDNGQPAGGNTEQAAGDSTGSAQVEPANVSAPIRVLSDGDDGVTATAADTTPDDDPSTGGGTTTPGGDDPAAGTDPAVGGGTPDLSPVDDTAPTGGDGGTLPDGGELLPVANGDVAGDTAADELPLTGLAVAALLLSGVALITGGGALRCAA